jgi:cytochrome c oxidase subunit II
VKQVPATIATLLIGILITLISLWYSQHNGLMPTSASAESPEIDGLFTAMLAIASGLFLLIQGALIYSAIAFRRKKEDNTDADPIEGDIPLEILWTAIPAALVLWLSVYSFDVYKSVDSGAFMGTHMAHNHTTEQIAHLPGAAIAAPLPGSSALETTPIKSLPSDQPEVMEPAGVGPAPDSPPLIAPTPNAEGPLAVNVAGLQYAWIFTYPETGVVSGELHLPVNREVKLTISANDVIHAFWVPQFRLKQDAIPGQPTYMSFMPTVTGDYPVVCAELCGAYHGAMKARAIVQTPEEFNAWMKSNQVAATPDAAAIATLTAPSQRTSSERLVAHAQGLGIAPAIAAGSEHAGHLHPSQLQAIAEHL